MCFIIFKKNRNNRGFTLAEVLITLVIIGIIAALTIPSLINKINNARYYTAFMTAYQALDQAARSIVEEHGGTLHFNDSSAPQEEVLDAFATKLNTIKKCYGSPGDCWNYSVTTLGGTQPEWDLPSSTDSVMILSNGMKVRFWTGLSGLYSDGDCNDNLYTHNGQNTGCLYFYLDINGDKSPNQLGRDVFVFILHKYGIAGIGTQGDNNYFYRDHPDYCNSSYEDQFYSGIVCTAKLLLEGKMNY